MDINVANKPSEKTHRSVKNLIVLAYVGYSIAVLIFLSAFSSPHGSELVFSAIILGVISLVIHKGLARLLNWYVSG